MGSARHRRPAGTAAAAARAAPLKRARRAARALPFALALAVCTERAPVPDAATPRAVEADSAAARVLARETGRIRARADAIDAIFQPLPLLRPQQEAALQRFGNAQQLAAARRLGTTPDPTAAQIDQLLAAGRLVRLADTTEFYIVRRLDHSAPYLTPDAEALLREIGRRFHAALQQLQLPPYRLEVTSVLRTAADQDALRRVNPNAALGESTHQYATTFDVAYSAFAPPAEPILVPATDETPWLEPFLLRAAADAAELVAARRSRELMAVLGRVLLALQDEGRVMVTLERLQPVYHMTVARP